VPRRAAATALSATHREGAWNRYFDWTAIGVLALLAAIAAFTFRHYGLGWDDYTHAEYGDLLVALYASGFRDTRALSWVNLYMYGGGFDLAAALVAKLVPFSLFETRRLMGAAVGILGLFITWRLGRRIGGPLAGLIALVLLATCPLYYGHMFMNPKDIPFAVAMALLLLGLVRAFEEYPSPSALTVVVLGVGLGLTLGTRIMGGMSALYALAAFTVILIGEARSPPSHPPPQSNESGREGALTRAGRFLLALIPGLVIGYAVMALVWPWSVTDPLNPLRAVGYFTQFFEKPWKEMYGGSLIPVPDMPRTYVPTLFALKLPELMLALAIAGTAGALLALTRPQVELRRRAILLMVAMAALFPIVLTIATKPAMYNGVRHFVFVMPPLAVLGGLAGSWLIERLGALSRPLGAVAALALVAGVAFPTVEMINLHPYQYTHFNRLAGGIRGADDRYMLDYWGLAFKQASQELRAKLAERQEAPRAGARWRVVVCGPERPAQVELGPDFQVTWDAKGADFVMMSGEFYCAKLKVPLLVQVEREGVVFARVYDVRGQSVSNLLTIPPP
jgi:hypothetical protein